MHSSSLSSPPTSTNFELETVLKTPTLKDSYQAFLAFGIKLHMLADDVAETSQQQTKIDQQQENCIAGQAAILNTASHQEIKSMECAQLMMSLWSEEVRQGQDLSKLTETDRIALKVFEFFQKKSHFHG